LEKIVNLIANLRIGSRLGIGFGLVIILLMAMALIGITKVNAIDHNTEIILHDRYVKVSLAHEIANEVNRQSRALRTALIAQNPDTVKSELAKVENSATQIGKAIDKLESIIQTEKGKAALKSLSAARSDFKSHEQELLGMINAGKIDEGRKFLVTEMIGPQTIYLTAIEDFQQSQVKGMEQFGEEAAAMTSSANTLMLVIAALATLLGVAIAVLLTRSITRPISQAVLVAETVAKGDLSTPIEATTADETGQLLSALKRMQDSLSKVVTTVRQGSDGVATASAQIAAGNTDLSNRT
jgi:methyl-accepting chemotaxis protein